ncbi:MAG: Ppx/GppA phosphatase family protein [Myxococcota bacterium]
MAQGDPTASTLVPLATAPHTAQALPQLPSHLAAVDLGSNSFHLALARMVGRELTVVDRVQERVQLAAGLNDAEMLDEATQERALACIERFGQRLRDTPGIAVRAVGTDALRVAKNAEAFLERAAALLGHPIEVLSGDEEARLIYRGVSQSLPDVVDAGGRLLVIDVGGGSTECIVGLGLEPEITTSLHMGCIGLTKAFFTDGALTRDRFRRAQIAAQLLFERLPPRYFRPDWARAYGSSGTMMALDEVLRANGWSPGSSGITKDGLTKLREAILAQGHVDRLQIPGLKPQRVGVITAGLAIARAAFKTLPLKTLATTSAALREGVLHDLLGRFLAHDIRETTIDHLQARFHADAAQAARVEETALRLFSASRWIEGKADDIERARRYLAWAARLHGIGLAISFHGYHKHGAYILANTALPGFSRDDTQALSVIILAHRKRIGREQFATLPRHLREMSFRLAVLLRLATRLERSPSERAPSAVSLDVSGRILTLRLPEGFLAAHALTQADLEEEVQRLAAAGLSLVVHS